MVTIDKDGPAEVGFGATECDHFPVDNGRRSPAFRENDVSDACVTPDNSGGFILGLVLFEPFECRFCSGLRVPASGPFQIPLVLIDLSLERRISPLRLFEKTKIPSRGNPGDGSVPCIQIRPARSFVSPREKFPLPSLRHGMGGCLWGHAPRRGP